jgi:dethiobiotin synthetase
MRAFNQQGLNVTGYKPVASGGVLSRGQLKNQDAVLLMQQSTVSVPYEVVNPYCFKPAIAPHIAAEKESCLIDMGVINASYQQLAEQSDVVIVEGAGGWCVPLTDSLSFNDIPVTLGIPVILVVGLKLGCINHALLTQMAILESGCRLVGWVANELEPSFEEQRANIHFLKNNLKTPFLGTVSFDSGNNIDYSCKNLDIKQFS